MRLPPGSILVPTDLAPSSLRALRHASLFRRRFGTRVTALHSVAVELPAYFTPGEAEGLLAELDRAKAAAARRVEAAVAAAGGADRVLVVDEPPTAAILRLGGSGGYDLVAMAPGRRGRVERLWLGSVTERVLREAIPPVLVARTDAPGETYGTILCAAAPEEGDGVLAAAARLAEGFGARLVALRVGTEGEPFAAFAASSGVAEVRTVPAPVPAAAILDAARDVGADLVVMAGRQKRSGLASWFSSTTERVARAIETNLLVLREEETR